MTHRFWGNYGAKIITALEQPRRFVQMMEAGISVDYLSAYYASVQYISVVYVVRGEIV